MELLLVFPIFVVLTLFAVDIGIWMYQSVTISNAVREAARFGAVNCGGVSPCDDTAIEQRAADRSSGTFSAADFEAGWVARPGAGAGEKGSSVVVRVNSGVTYDFLFFPGISLRVYSCADMRMERGTTSTAAGSDC